MVGMRRLRRETGSARKREAKDAPSHPPLPQTIASEVPAGPAGENGGSNAPPLQESYPLKAAGERQKKDELPVNASLLTRLVLVISSFGGSVLWLLARHACRQGAICSWGLEGGDRRWLATVRVAPSSLLGVFRL